jgi:NAD(P)H-dependent FMN reductase
LNLALIIGSTRPNRFVDYPARWIAEQAKLHREFTLESLDLRDHPLPFFREATPPAVSGGAFTDVDAIAWDQRVAAYDGFLVTAAEYNRGPAAVLCNALDSAYNGWKKKPIAFVGYGAVGGARAIEDLRLTAIGLQMAPINAAVHIPFSVCLDVSQKGMQLEDFEHLNQSLNGLFAQMVWWANALKAARGV